VAAAVLTGGGWWYVIAQRIDTAQLAAMLPAAPPRDPMPPKLAPAPAPDAPAPSADYLIQVALFANRERAEQVLFELNNAGFRAREVERDFGPRRGRLSQVIVGGYDSALAVERDLQRIRELPGYRDAYLLVPKKP